MLWLLVFSHRQIVFKYLRMDIISNNRPYCFQQSTAFINIFYQTVPIMFLEYGPASLGKLGGLSHTFYLQPCLGGFSLPFLFPIYKKEALVKWLLLSDALKYSQTRRKIALSAVRFRSIKIQGSLLILVFYVNTKLELPIYLFHRMRCLFRIAHHSAVIESIHTVGCWGYCSLGEITFRFVEIKNLI